MLIGETSKYLLKKTQAKSKMYEYDIPLAEHVEVESSAIKLLLIAMGSLDEAARYINNLNTEEQFKLTEERSSDLHFSAIFFDSLISSKIYGTDNTEYFYLLGSVSYYFCDYIGSSKVMLEFIDKTINVNGDGFEKIIWHILSNSINPEFLKELFDKDKFEDGIYPIIKDFYNFKKSGSMPDFTKYDAFYQQVLTGGSSRASFLCELVLALLKMKVFNSASYLLPTYTKIPSIQWNLAINNNDHIRELWPAQRKFGEHGLFEGISGVVQMPTSSGKTTGICLVLQSTFMRSPNKNAFIVAPFRALCKEITRDLKEFFEKDSNVQIKEIFDLPNKNDTDEIVSNYYSSVFVLTPEKLFFLLRINENLLDNVSTIIFDEAHLFDDSTRGTSYELLVATIKKLVHSSTQLILISAVVPNADVINDWINGESGTVISDNSIRSTEKSIAIGDWEGNRNRLIFINPDNPDNELYYVPRVVETQELKKFPNERKKRFFPDVNINKRSKSEKNPNDLSIYYALSLLHNGSIAIFCGLKQTVGKIIERIIELENRGVDVSPCINSCNHNENNKIAHLISVNLGPDSKYALGAVKGIFAHHADIPTGIKNSIEYAMSKKFIGLIVCTSTLAQGVNLPIKYLIVSNVFQSGKRISVRDFHNLIGRTGRAGKYTEGSVILSEPFVYSERKSRQKGYKWDQYKQLIETDNSEPCESTILQLVRPVKFYLESIHGKVSLNFFELILSKYDNLKNYNYKINKLYQNFVSQYPKQLRNLESTLKNINTTLSSIESYIINYLSKSVNTLDIDPEEIAKETLGYYLSTEDEKTKIIQLFTVIFMYVNKLSKDQINLISQTSFGFFEGTKLLNWTNDEVKNLLKIETDEQIINQILVQILESSNSTIVKRLVDINSLKDICKLWITGMSYYDICNICCDKHFKIKRYKKLQELNINDVVQICDKLFSYDCITSIAAIQNFLSSYDEFYQDDLFDMFQQKLKYGLPDKQSIMIYELGFSDRYVAQLISKTIPKKLYFKYQVQNFIRSNKMSIKEILKDFPQFFYDILEKI